MSWRPAVLLPLIFALTACAEGGSRGSGISTAVLGNVQAVQAAVARGRTAVEGIRVTVEGTGAHDQTDANGNFTVQGGFEGLIGLVFELPGGGGEARITLNVPAAGRLTLNNVIIDAQSGEASAETLDVDFEGIIDGVYCHSLTMALMSSHETSADADLYTLQLDTSTVRDSQGNTVACADIPEGALATVEGMVNPDGTFGDATVQLED
jgi:hypothetical protein